MKNIPTNILIYLQISLVKCMGIIGLNKIPTIMNEINKELYFLLYTHANAMLDKNVDILRNV